MKKKNDFVGIKFLKEFFDYVKYSFNKLKTFHEILLQNPKINLKRDLIIWILDVVQYGFVATLYYLLINRYGLLGFALGFGISLWLLRHIILNIREALK